MSEGVEAQRGKEEGENGQQPKILQGVGIAQKAKVSAEGGS